MILVQQRKQAKIGFETFRSKYIKLCVSSDVGKKEIQSERKRTCFLKDRLREKSMTWMMSGEKTFTPGGQL